MTDSNEQEGEWTTVSKVKSKSNTVPINNNKSTNNYNNKKAAVSNNSKSNKLVTAEQQALASANKQTYSEILYNFEQKHHLHESSSAAVLKQNIVGLSAVDFCYNHGLSGHSLKNNGHNTGSIYISAIDDKVLNSPQLISATPNYARPFKSFLNREFIDFSQFFIHKTENKEQNPVKISKYAITQIWLGHSIQFYKYYPSDDNSNGNNTNTANFKEFCIGIKPLESAYLPAVLNEKQNPYTILIDYLRNHLKLLPLLSASQYRKQFKSNGNNSTYTAQELQLIELFQQFHNPDIQSITCEYIGSNTRKDNLINYNIPIALVPLFITYNSGSIKPVLNPVNLTNLSLNSNQESLSNFAFISEFSQAELVKQCETLISSDEQFNEQHRKENNLILQYEDNQFKSIGRNIYCLDHEGFVINRTVFQLLTQDYELVDTQYFDSALELQVRKAVEKFSIEVIQNLFPAEKSAGNTGNGNNNDGDSDSSQKPKKTNSSSKESEAKEREFGNQLKKFLNMGDRNWSRFRTRIISYARLLVKKQLTNNSIPNALNPTDKRKMIVLVAYPGAGKSYFSTQLLTKTNSLAVNKQILTQTNKKAPSKNNNNNNDDEKVVANNSTPDTSSVLDNNNNNNNSNNNSKLYIRVNQDEMKTRAQCELIAARALDLGYSVIVDRTNIDPDQRSYWFELASKHKLHNNNISCVYLQIPVQICKQRVFERVDHPTLTPSLASVNIVDRFCYDFIPPCLEEGFQAVHTVKNEKEAVELLNLLSNSQ